MSGDELSDDPNWYWHGFTDYEADESSLPSTNYYETDWLPDPEPPWSDDTQRSGVASPNHPGASEIYEAPSESEQGEDCERDEEMIGAATMLMRMRYGDELGRSNED
jgi:hypothetical protein